MTQEVINVKSFLEYVLPERRGMFVEGQHPKLSLWQNWYAGYTNWHNVQVRKGNKFQWEKRKSSGIAKTVCNDWACNYANDNTKISIAKKGQNEIVNRILNANRMFSKFNGLIEQAFALGMGATVVVPSSFVADTNGKILKDPLINKADVKIYKIKANRIIPITIDDGEIIECAFIRYITNRCYLQLHVVVDGVYHIYECLGYANKSMKSGYDFDFSSIIHINTYSRYPFYQIWHPVIVDNKDIDEEVPCSIFVNCLDLFKLLDVELDAFYAEFNNGKKKRLISSELQYIDANGNTQTLQFDDEEFYLPPGLDAKALVQEFNGELRVDAFVKAINFTLNLISAECGLGDTRFKFDGNTGTIQTATGVVAENSILYKNILKQENLATDRFKKMLMAIQYVSNTYTANPKLNFTEEDITIEYDDNLVEDTETKKQQELAEVNAGTMSIIEYRMHWYDEDEKTATENAQKFGLLGNQYLTLLQAGAITPKTFVSRVYGENAEDKEELTRFIEQRYSPQIDFDYNDEDEENEEGGADE